MRKFELNSDRTLEIMLILVTAALACVLFHAGGMKLVVLNLFYLPVVLAGFFLGRYRAGVLALFSVVAAITVIALDLSEFAAFTSPLMIGLAVTLWGATLGLTSLLVGTLCDDRFAKSVEAHEAHVGVIEVLSRYLQSANPRLESRAKRVAQLSEDVARKMRLSSKEIDDIRVAALLIDMENIEITARVIRKAVGELQSDDSVEQRTIHGAELVQSLGNVLTGAFPLILNQTKVADHAADNASEIPFGARIIRTVRAYVQLADDPWGNDDCEPQAVIDELRCDIDADYHPAVLHALASVVLHPREATRNAAPVHTVLEAAV